MKVPFILNLQDFVGQSNGASTKEDAVAWINYLKTSIAEQPKAVTLNTEQFTQSSNGAITAADTAEVANRENYYSSQGIKLGPAWEIRFWAERLNLSEEANPSPPSTPVK